MDFIHESVLLKESIEKLNIKKTGIYVDGTLGGGGHSFEICQKLSSGKLIGIDQDESALDAAKAKLSEYRDLFTPVKSNFSELDNILKKLQIEKIDGFLLDLGVSSHQFDEGSRGFSYRFDAKLDMRMDINKPLSAWNVVNEYDEKHLANILWKFSDERWSKRIAEFILRARSEKPINTTFELVNIIKQAIPLSARKDGGHPAKRTFQAIRMEVNSELEVIESVVEKASKLLNKGGRIVIITFHSIEDGLVKNLFKKLENPCECPKDFPVCNCGKMSTMKIIRPQVVLPSKEEIERNTRAKSAKMRVIEKRI